MHLLSIGKAFVLDNQLEPIPCSKGDEKPEVKEEKRRFTQSWDQNLFLLKQRINGFISYFYFSTASSETSPGSVHIIPWKASLNNNGFCVGWLLRRMPGNLKKEGNIKQQNHLQDLTDLISQSQCTSPPQFDFLKCDTHLPCPPSSTS